MSDPLQEARRLSEELAGRLRDIGRPDLAEKAEALGALAQRVEDAERGNERLRKLAQDIARADVWWLMRFARERARQALRQEEER